MAMGVARQLKHEKSDHSAGEKNMKPVRPSHSPDVIKRLTERFAPILSFRHTMRGFHYCKHRKCGNGWWIDTGRDNAYRKFAFILGRNPLFDKAVLPFRQESRHPLAQSPSKAKPVEAMPVAFAEKKAGKNPESGAVHFVHEEDAPVVKNERRNSIEKTGLPVKAETNVPYPECREAKAEFIPVPKTDLKLGEAPKAKVAGHRAGQETRTEKYGVKTEKAEPKKEETKECGPFAPAVKTGKTGMPAERIRFATVERKARTGTASMKRRTEKRTAGKIKAPKPETTDVAIKAAPFAYFAASAKGTKAEPETIVKNIVLQIPKTERRKEEKRDDIYDVLKGLRYQKILAPKVASAADSLN